MTPGLAWRPPAFTGHEGSWTDMPTAKEDLADVNIMFRDMTKVIFVEVSL